jgi:hypothetical protein
MGPVDVAGGEQRVVARWSAATPWAWAATSFAGFMASGVLAALAFGAGMWAVPWVLLAAFGVLALGRIAFAAWLPVPAVAAAVLIAGVVLSGAVEASLRDWAMARFGLFDPDYVGITAVFFVVVAGVAVAGFGSLIAPRGAVLPPALAVLAGFLLTMLIVFSDVPGLSDGLDPESTFPAAIIGVAGLYVGAVAVLSLHAWRRSPISVR